MTYITFDSGKSSAIALALETNKPFLIFDDAQARFFALDLGLSITGTFGILIAAYRHGIIGVVQKLKFLNNSH
jgi:predicted nucleic acid-binding protein